VPRHGDGEYLFAGEFLSVLFVIFPNIDQIFAPERGDGHSAHFGDFPITIPVGIDLACLAGADL